MRLLFLYPVLISACVWGRKIVESVVPSSPESPFEYQIYQGRYAASYAEAMTHCEANQGSLVDVDMTIVAALGRAISEPVYIASWNDDDYQQSDGDSVCLALSPGGTVNVPSQGCQGPLGYICQIPLTIATATDSAVTACSPLTTATLTDSPIVMPAGTSIDRSSFACPLVSASATASAGCNCHITIASASPTFTAMEPVPTPELSSCIMIITASEEPSISPQGDLDSTSIVASSSYRRCGRCAKACPSSL